MVGDGGVVEVAEVVVEQFLVADLALIEAVELGLVLEQVLSSFDPPRPASRASLDDVLRQRHEVGAAGGGARLQNQHVRRLAVADREDADLVVLLGGAWGLEPVHPLHAEFRFRWRSRCGCLLGRARSLLFARAARVTRGTAGGNKRQATHGHQRQKPSRKPSSAISVMAANPRDVCSGDCIAGERCGSEDGSVGGVALGLPELRGDACGVRRSRGRVWCQRIGILDKWLWRDSVRSDDL